MKENKNTNLQYTNAKIQRLNKILEFSKSKKVNLKMNEVFITSESNKNQISSSNSSI